jgi:arylsulfatase A-like enzyme
MTRLCLILAVFCSLATPSASAEKPNVIIMMPDDMSFNDLSFYDADGPRTPRLDRLAGESVRLTDFHVSPTCSPTRAALMTGRYNDATGVWHTILGRSVMHRDEVTMADVFQANGYGTSIFSKWHLGPQETASHRPHDAATL